MKKIVCWWFGCRPIFGSENHGDGVMPCERCGAPDTTYEHRVGDTRHANFIGWLKHMQWRLFYSWRPAPCPACGQRGTCKPGCDGIPF